MVMKPIVSFQRWFIYENGLGPRWASMCSGNHDRLRGDMSSVGVVHINMRKRLFLGQRVRWFMSYCGQWEMWMMVIMK